jgi:uncharacterized protein (TIGR02145 family)
MCSKDTGWICPNGTFQELYGIEKGHDGEVIKANFTSFLYAYDSIQGKWVSAHVEQGIACVSSKFGMVLASESMGKPSYLVCKVSEDNPNYLYWAATSDSAYIAYNTQGLECDSLGRIQKGLKDTTSKFVCSNGQFKIPSSLDLNMGFTCNLVNEGYFKYQNSNYHCDGVKWEYATDSLVIDSIVDERNNVLYKTVGIGSQVWMKENLNYIVDSSYCFRDDKELCKIYGRLYQWNANIGSKDEKDNICPKGFHVPSSKDWETLKSFVRSTFDRVDYTRILGTKDGWEKRTEWYIGNEDLVGFSALPSGMRGNRGLYDEEYDAAYFCTTDYTDTSYTAYKLQKLGREYLFGVESAKNSVCALRCLKD